MNDAENKLDSISVTNMALCARIVTLIFFECFKICCKPVFVIIIIVGMRIAEYKVSDYRHRVITTALRI